MERFIAGLNIERFRRKLESETNETKRRMLVRLLWEEQKTLAALIEKSTDKIGFRELGLGQA